MNVDISAADRIALHIGGRNGDSLMLKLYTTDGYTALVAGGKKKGVTLDEKCLASW